MGALNISCSDSIKAFEVFLRDEFFFQFPQARPATGRTPQEAIAGVKDQFLAATFRGVKSQITDSFSCFHICSLSMVVPFTSRDEARLAPKPIYGVAVFFT